METKIIPTPIVLTTINKETNKKELTKFCVLNEKHCKCFKDKGESDDFRFGICSFLNEKLYLRKDRNDNVVILKPEECIEK